jgi:hypothetical protein
LGNNILDVFFCLCNQLTEHSEMRIYL